MRSFRQLSLAASLATATVWPSTAQDRSYPPKLPGATVEVYKTVGGVTLSLFIFKPADRFATGDFVFLWWRFRRRLAGGLIAACVGTIQNLDGPNENSQVSYRPNAMVLFNPAILGKMAIERTDPDGRPSFTNRIMPFGHVRENLPPTIMFFGTEDRLLAGAQEFHEAAVSHGNRCELQTWEGVGHGFFNLGRNNNREFVATLKSTDKFLTSLGYLTGDETVDALEFRSSRSEK